jgi:hypothetical protein
MTDRSAKAPGSTLESTRVDQRTLPAEVGVQAIIVLCDLSGG